MGGQETGAVQILLESEQHVCRAAAEAFHVVPAMNHTYLTEGATSKSPLLLHSYTHPSFSVVQ